MLNDIIKKISDILTAEGASPVYSAFDAVPADRKNKGIYTVVGINSFESMTPVYSEYMVYLPFKAEIDINVTAPENYSAESVYKYFAEYIEPTAVKIPGINCMFKKISIKYDSNINRLVLTARLSAVGLKRIERSGI